MTPASVLRSAVKLIALAALPLLASCAADTNPSPAPTGYKYQNQQYNAPYTGPVKPMSYPGMNGPQPAPADLATPMAPVPGAPAPLAPATGPMPVYNPGPQTSAAPAPVAPGAVNPGAGGPSAGPVWHQAAADLMNRTEHDFGHMRDAIYIRPPVTPGETLFVQALTDTLRQRNYKLSTDLQKSAFVADYNVGAPGPTGQAGITLKIAGQDGHSLQQETGDYAVSGDPAVMAAAMPVAAPLAVPPPWPHPAAAPAPQTVAQAYPAQAAPAQGIPTQGMPAQGIPSNDAPAQGYPSQTTYSGQPAPQTAPSQQMNWQAPVPGNQPGQDIPPVINYSPQTQQIPATPGSVAVSDGKTYVYDGRATKPAGHTAYEQMQGVEHVVGRNDELADR